MVRHPSTTSAANVSPDRARLRRETSVKISTTTLNKQFKPHKANTKEERSNTGAAAASSTFNPKTGVRVSTDSKGSPLGKTTRNMAIRKTFSMDSQEADEASSPTVPQGLARKKTKMMEVLEKKMSMRRNEMINQAGRR